MKNIFDHDGVKVVEAFCMANTLFAFDYDGTLAPIVTNPETAHMTEQTTRLIRDLSALVPVALISGRARSDLARFVPRGVDYVIGNHGLEGIPGGSPSLEHAESASRRWVGALQPLLSYEGVSIEDKKYSLAVHYRLSPDKRIARAAILEAVSSLSPAPRIVMGKCVVNLVSPGAPHKGVALLEVMLRSGCRSAVYIGDDDNDEDVFRLGEESLLTIRVGKKTDSAAVYYLSSQKQVDLLIEIFLKANVKAGKVRRDVEHRQ